MESEIAVRRVTAFTRAYEARYERYQAYYRHGLLQACETRGAEFRTGSMTRMAPLLRAARHVRDRYLAQTPARWVLKAADRAAQFAEGSLRAPASTFHHLVGQYLVVTFASSRASGEVGTPSKASSTTSDYSRR